MVATGLKKLATIFAVFGVMIVLDPALYANKAGERRIAFYNIHTKDTVDVVYKRNGRRIPEAMKKINWVLRDWRQDKATNMDPKLIDILWEMHTELGSRQPIHVISGYRSQKTNAMLRKTRGGQASKSRHILGKAADVHFPDVPVKRLRYSAMVRQRGGVGYYPTSAIPFVHVDTGRVRHWPRMPRTELALLFPSGKTKHRPPDNRAITAADVRKARNSNRRLATEVAAFHNFRRSPRAPRPTLVAENRFTAGNPAQVSNSWGAPRVTRADAARDRLNGNARPTQQRPMRERLRLAALPAPARPPELRGPAPITASRNDPAPRLMARPHLAERPVDRATQLTARPAENDRSKLTDLFTFASFFPMNGWFGSSDTDAAVPPPRGSVAAAEPRVDDLDPSGFVSAPAYDEEHPEELYYRPFPLAPLLTASASIDDPALTHMEAPDPSQTVAMLDEDLASLPMRFSPQKDVAAAMWADHFEGRAVRFGAAPAVGRDLGHADQRLASRGVQTTAR